MAWNFCRWYDKRQVISQWRILVENLFFKSWSTRYWKSRVNQRNSQDARTLTLAPPVSMYFLLDLGLRWILHFVDWFMPLRLLIDSIYHASVRLMMFVGKLSTQVMHVSLIWHQFDTHFWHIVLIAIEWSVLRLNGWKCMCLCPASQPTNKLSNQFKKSIA